MPPYVERLLWVVLLVAAATAPVLAFIAVALLVVQQFARGAAAAWSRLRRLQRAWPPLSLLAVGALAAVQVPTGRPWLDLVGLIGWGACLALLVPWNEHTAEGEQLVEALLLGCAMAIAVQAVLSLPELAGWFRAETARASGSTGHPNLLASATLASAAALAVLSPRLTGARRVAALLSVVLALFLVLATGSRAVVLGAALGGLVWAAFALWAGAPGRRRTALLVLAVTVGAPLVLAAVRGLPADGLLTRDAERAEVLSVGLDLAAARPLIGHGDADWEDLVTRAEPSLPAGVFSHAHSVLLHVMVHGGSLGVVLAVALVLGGLRALRQRVVAALVCRGVSGPVLAATAGGLAAQSAVDLVVINPAVYLAVAALVAALVVGPQRYHPRS